MSSFRQIYYHLVFGTKNRVPAIEQKNEEQLYKYISGILKSKNCYLYQINGMPDHIHIFFDLHPSIALSDLVKDIKVATNKWIRENKLFPLFTEWQVGYGAFTKSQSDKEKIIRYIINQKEHHKKVTFEEEYIDFLKEHGIPFDPKYLF